MLEYFYNKYPGMEFEFGHVDRVKVIDGSDSSQTKINARGAMCGGGSRGAQ